MATTTVTTTVESEKVGARGTAAEGPAWLRTLNERAFKIAHADTKNPVWDTVRAGRPVYVERFTPLVYFYSAIAAASLVAFAYYYGLLALSVLTFVIFVYSDFKGALTHVVLDEPKNVDVPAIGQSALEFQMHHEIPRDNVIKPYVEMCGDLNVYISVCLGLNTFVFGPSVIFCGLGALMLLGGYAGQWSHRCAHMTMSQRPAWMTKLQDWGIMLPAAQHALHHQTHDGNFPILSGWTTTLVQRMVATVPSRAVWLSAFCFAAIFDVGIFYTATKAVLG